VWVLEIVDGAYEQSRVDVRAGARFFDRLEKTKPMVGELGVPALDEVGLLDDRPEQRRDRVEEPPVLIIDRAHPATEIENMQRATGKRVAPPGDRHQICEQRPPQGEPRLGYAEESECGAALPHGARGVALLREQNRVGVTPGLATRGLPG